MKIVAISCRISSGSLLLLASGGVAATSQWEVTTETLRPLLWWGLTAAGLIGGFALWRHFTAQTDPPPPVARRFPTALLLIFLVILLAVAIPLANVLWRNPPTDTDLVVRVTGSQWHWHFAYEQFQHQPLSGPEFISALQMPPGVDADTLAEKLFPKAGGGPVLRPEEVLEVDSPLVLPAGMRVRFLITSDDIVHAWWIPGLNVKKEAIPGFENRAEVSIPAVSGVYRGLCSQLCGQDHAFMPIVVQVVPADDFGRWLSTQKATLAQKKARRIPDNMATTALLAQGQAVYAARCALCHQQNGEGWPERFPPLVDSPRINGDVDELVSFVGKGRNTMPGMRDILPADDVAALLTYMRKTWGNATVKDTVVQPEYVAEIHE